MIANGHVENSIQAIWCFLMKRARINCDDRGKNGVCNTRRSGNIGWLYPRVDHNLPTRFCFWKSLIGRLYRYEKIG
jgi:hypothetical protein